jgi:CRISPR-associated endonuclease/helicase Cas3
MHVQPHISAPTTSSLWAKLKRDAAGEVSGWHSLVDHSADVAAVIEALLAQPTINQRLARAAGRTDLDTRTCERLAALAFLHDIGKANRGFRRRIDPQAPTVGHIDQLAWVFKSASASNYAEALSVRLGLERTEAWFAPDDSGDLWDTLFAHHGRPWSADPAHAEQFWRRDATGSDPVADLAPMRVALDRWFAPAFSAGPPLPAAPSFHHAFAGLLMLADWLGSDTRFFPYANGAAADRLADARTWAPPALRAVGLALEDRRVDVRSRAPAFNTLFAGTFPRPIQQDASLPGAQCVVLEAETGSGKTEAALWRFRHLFEAGAVDGLYFALPTRVAATQMFARVKRFRDALFPTDDRPAVVLAVPGQVGVDDARGHPLPDFGFEWKDDADEAARQRRWAAEHPKRFLAAQIAVGTVDQALLAAIATRHAHMRGTALLRHLLVVDEVHASDRYMETLLGNLLRGHTQAGGHALLLSATLGAGMHARLLGTPCLPLAAAETVPYPALSWAEGGHAEFHRVQAAGAAKQVRLETAALIDDPAAVAAMALQAAAAGAKVLVIRNTVGAAIATAQALEATAGAEYPALFRAAGVATLHHGRFAPIDRQLLDAAVEISLGKASPAEARVVIGTQTLEQSLDLDADILLTDLCPVDVLLQRIGRLHRHSRTRPAGFVEARAIVLTPRTRDLLPFMRAGRGRHGLGRVYEDARIIEATWRLIAAEPFWRIPEMNRHLVEQATHPERLAAIEDELRARDGAWAGVLNASYANNIAQAQQAGLGLLDRSAPFRAFRIPEGERWATRLGAKDLLATFPTPPMGPFGQTVATVRVPHFLAGEATGDEPEVIASGPDGLLFRLGPMTLLRYDRFGLRRTES